MAANGGSDGHEHNEGFIQHEHDGDKQSEGTGHDMSGMMTPQIGGVTMEPAVTPGTTSTLTMIPVPTTMVLAT